MDIKKEKCVGGTFSKHRLTRLAAGSKKCWMDSNLFENWVCE